MKTIVLILHTTLVIVCLGLLGETRAVVPPPDGGYPNFTTAEGNNALKNLTTGAANTGVGWYSLFSNTDGSYNTAVGAGTLLFNVGDQSAGEGVDNTAVGAAALLFNTTGFDNTAVGTAALLNNTIANGNTAVGDRALFNNTEAASNTAMGAGALFFNTAPANTAIGRSALFSNAKGEANTANGAFALHDNTSGDSNTANGANALAENTTGSLNTATGFGALGSNTEGNFNTADGINALAFNTTGTNNIALGQNAGNSVTTANNVICIGNFGQNVSNSCYIGNVYSNVQPVVGTDPDSVTINSAGRLGRGNLSSRRYKHDIKPLDKASEVLFALKPVSFRYNTQYDATQTLAFGLIAEEVAEVAPHLVGRNPEGQPESVRYEQINAMLLNEFLKEHRTVQHQGAMIAELRKEIAILTRTVKEQAAQIQNVSVQIELSERSPTCVVVSDQ